MAVTEWHVTEAGNDSTGDGSIGTPWRTTVKAMGASGIVATGQGGDGDRLNVGPGIHVLTAELSGIANGYMATFSPTNLKPFFFKGAAASSAILDGDETFSIFNNSAKQHVHFTALTCRNTAANVITRVGHYSSLTNCIFHNSAAIGYHGTSTTGVYGSEFYDIGGTNACQSSSTGSYYHWSSGEKDPSSSWINGLTTTRNIIQQEAGCSTSNPILATSQNSVIIANSIFAVASTGTGIFFNNYALAVYNNIIEGFSGVGGDGISASSDQSRHLFCCNAVFNCTNPYLGNVTEADGWAYVNNNETLSVSPFVNAAGGNFAPVDTGNVWGGGWPTVRGSAPDKGAVQRLAGGGGGDIYPYPRPRIYGIG